MAARLAGVNPDTVHEWMQRGKGLDKRPATEELRLFADAVEHAKAQAEATMLAAVIKAAPTDPASARWWLENEHPDWRRHRMPVPDELPVSSTVVQNVIVIDRATLEEIALRRLHAEREASNGHEPARDISALITVERTG